ncbi:MAG: universal stress protein [Acidobacteriota bacterium]|nr:universal stress protein [Acidobacteriota bacterium]
MPQPKKILVGLKDVEHAAALTRLACRMAGRGASLLLVHVIELPDVTPLDAEVFELEAAAAAIFRAALRETKRAGVKASTLVIRAHSASYALLDELKQRKMELAVLGYHHKRSAAELVFGTTAVHLLRHAPCELLLSIQPEVAEPKREAAAEHTGGEALTSAGVTF